MTALQIGVLALLAAIIGKLPKGRQLAMLAVSTAAILWLEPAQQVVGLGFWLPFATLSITAAAWVLTSSATKRDWIQSLPAAGILAGILVLAAANRTLRLITRTANATPNPLYILTAIIAVVTAVAMLYAWQRKRSFFLTILLVVLIAIFVVIKTPALANAASAWLAARQLLTENTSQPLSLAWFGFSYVAFRILHTIRDKQAGRLPAMSLGEYANYVIFFPAYTAGPIDRVQRFVDELRLPVKLEAADAVEAVWRIVWGMFKKFVLAELLAVIAIRDPLIPYVSGAGWLWLFLYAYAFRIYLDFSGYTDVAIGIGRLCGIHLPENFASPYLKPNIALFWNSWHMSLTQWFRSYVFNPMARGLRSLPRPIPAWLIILLTQACTMLLIGLWHGITWSFAAWGLWHALGLFVHNRWIEITRNRLPAWMGSAGGQMAARILGVFVTFQYVSIGWLFFALPSPAAAVYTILRLFGAS